MFAWSCMVAAHWIAYCTRTGDQKQALLVLATVYTIQHLVFDVIWFSPGCIYYPSCALSDLLIYHLIKNFSYKLKPLNLLLCLSVCLNSFGYFLYMAYLPNIMYDLPIMVLHAYIIYLLCKDHNHGHGRS